MTADDAFAHALPAGTDVQGYRIRSVLGAGGFGVTYLAEHVAMNHQVALKEFLPSGIAARAKTGDTVRPMSPAHQEDFAWGLMRFREEARTLARLKHHAIVPVLNYFEANGTAYCVMEYVAGATLDAQLGLGGTLDADELARMLPPLLAGIEAVHAAGFLHRDIKPSNILMSARGAPVLIDFGAARQALGAHSRSLTAVLSEGYAPYEQYQRDGDQGPWTDIYALGGTLYRCVTGERPPEATKRIQASIKKKPDPMKAASEAAAGRYPPVLLAAIDRALALMETDRPQSIAEFRLLIEVPATGPSTLVADTAPPRARSADTTLSPDAPPRATRRRRLWPVAAALVVLVGGGAVTGYVVIEQGRSEARRLAAEREEARRKAEEAEGKRKAEEAAARRKAEAERAAEERRREAKSVTDCDRLAAADDPRFNVERIAGVPSRDIKAELAIDACRRAVERFPEEARFKAYLSRAYYAAKQFDEAYATARPAATEGDPVAQTVIGAILIAGEGVTIDLVLGIRWLRAAADKDYAVAQVNLGSRYWAGTVVTRDDVEACRLYRRAAENDYLGGQFGYGLCFEAGRGVPQDNTQALYWLGRAADRGHPSAQYFLGSMYEKGRGVTANLYIAIQWYRKAVAKGDESAKSALARLGASHQ